MSAWVRRALCQVANRSATRAMAIARKAAVNTRVMLGVRRRPRGGAGVCETGGDEVMRPSISRALGARDKSARRGGRLAVVRPARYARRDLAIVRRFRV